MVSPIGIEPTASGLGIQRSIQLSYEDRKCMNIVNYYSSIAKGFMLHEHGNPI